MKTYLVVKWGHTYKGFSLSHSKRMVHFCTKNPFSRSNSRRSKRIISVSRTKKNTIRWKT